MQLSSFQKLIVIVVILAVLGLGAYFMFIKTPTEKVSIDQSTLGQNILVLTEQLKRVTIDPALFSSPLFTTLRDLSVNPAVEPLGRPNPFAPIGSDAKIAQTANAVSSASTTAIKKTGATSR